LIKDILSDSYHIFKLQEPCGSIKRAANPAVLGTHTAKSNNKKGILKIEVVDTGCGISDEFSTEMWGAFQQNDISIQRIAGGMGLGLHIVKELTKLMKGEVRCYTNKDIGSNFMCLLPVSQDIRKIEEVLDLNPSLSLNLENNMNIGHHALVVEDNPCNQFVLKGYFKKLGIDIILASNGKEGFDTYISQREGFFSFMTLDLQMPEVDGITCAKNIRKYEKDNDITIPIPIVIVTANTSEEEKRQCIASTGLINARYFYQKPLRYEECQMFVETILQEKMKRAKTEQDFH